MALPLTRNVDGVTIELGAEEEAAVRARWAAAVQARAAKAPDLAWERIKRERDRRTLGGGYSVVVGGTAKWFHSDTLSRTEQIGLARKADLVQAQGGSMTVPFPGPGPGGLLFWKTMDGSFVPMTPALAQAIFDAADAQDTATFAAGEAHRAAMQQSADPAAYDFSGGWPAIFGG